MTILRPSRRTAAWLALAGMVLNAAWPVLANAKPANPAAEICSATGSKHAGGAAPATPDKGYHASHCNLCPYGTERGAAIAAIGPLHVPLSAPVLARARGDAPRVALALYPTAPPRAPPTLA